MNEDLRARIAGELAGTGLAGFRDTTSGMRPQWRASFSFSGELHGEKSYVHIYVPSGADELQVNCSAPSPELNPVPAEQLQDQLEEANAEYAPGSARWEEMLDALGAAADGTAGWETTTRPYQGLADRMMLTRITMPLSGFSGSSVELAIRVGLHVARGSRERLSAAWQASRDGKAD